MVRHRLGSGPCPRGGLHRGPLGVALNAPDGVGWCWVAVIHGFTRHSQMDFDSLEKHIATKELLYFLSEESVRILLLYLSAQNERRSVHTGYALNAHLPRGQLVENKGSGQTCS